jgi:hypothetical protein
MKILTFNTFSLNENQNIDKSKILENIKFRNKSLNKWIQQADTHNDFIKEESSLMPYIEGVVEQYETYHQDEYPTEVVKDIDAFKAEVEVYGKTLLNILGAIDTGYIQEYVGQSIEWKEEWKDSSKLKDTDKNTGLLSD